MFVELDSDVKWTSRRRGRTPSLWPKWIHPFVASVGFTDRFSLYFHITKPVEYSRFLRIKSSTSPSGTLLHCTTSRWCKLSSDVVDICLCHTYFVDLSTPYRCQLSLSIVQQLFHSWPLLTAEKTAKRLNGYFFCRTLYIIVYFERLTYTVKLQRIRSAVRPIIATKESAILDR